MISGGNSSLGQFTRVGLDFPDGGGDVLHVRALAEQHGLREPNRFLAEPVIRRSTGALGPLRQ